jgi:hypothetical protein
MNRNKRAPRDWGASILANGAAAAKLPESLWLSGRVSVYQRIAAGIGISVPVGLVKQPGLPKPRAWARVLPGKCGLGGKRRNSSFAENSGQPLDTDRDSLQVLKANAIQCALEPLNA